MKKEIPFEGGGAMIRKVLRGGAILLCGVAFLPFAVILAPFAAIYGFLWLGSGILNFAITGKWDTTV